MEGVIKTRGISKPHLLCTNQCHAHVKAQLPNEEEWMTQVNEEGTQESH
jgi:hypothetical protein